MFDEYDKNENRNGNENIDNNPPIPYRETEESKISLTKSEEIEYHNSQENKESSYSHRPHRGYDETEEFTEETQRKYTEVPRKQGNPDNNSMRDTKSQDKYYHERVKETPPKKKKSWSRFIAACLVVSLVGGSTMGISLGITQKYLDMWSGSSQESVPTTSSVKTSVSKVVNGSSAVDIIKEVKPSVVSISTKGEVVQYGWAIGEAVGAGSGVVFYSDDEKIGIATNDHVIEGAKEISVTFDDEKTVAAKIAGTDNTSDLAVLIVTKEDLTQAGIDEVKVASFGDSDGLEVGESVIAIGNALGEGITVTDGIISATGKKINVDGKELQVIQTNAAINEGNSGGALVNSNGEVIGINTAKAFKNAAEGMGYAIPSNIITPIVDRLLKEGTEPKPYIGIRGSDIPDDAAQLYKLPVGVLVVEVIQGGSAEQAGIEPGDIITEFAGESIMSMDKLVEVLSNQEVGNTAKAHIIRDGSTPMDVTVQIMDANKQ